MRHYRIVRPPAQTNEPPLKPFLLEILELVYRKQAHSWDKKLGWVL